MLVHILGQFKALLNRLVVCIDVSYMISFYWPLFIMPLPEHTYSYCLYLFFNNISLSLSLCLWPVVPFGDSWLLVPLVDSLVTYGIHSNMAHNVNSESGLE